MLSLENVYTKAAYNFIFLGINNTVHICQLILLDWFLSRNFNSHGPTKDRDEGLLLDLSVFTDPPAPYQAVLCSWSTSKSKKKNWTTNIGMTQMISILDILDVPGPRWCPLIGISLAISEVKAGRIGKHFSSLHPLITRDFGNFWAGDSKDI